MPTTHIRALVQDQVTVLHIQFPGNEPGKATEISSSTSHLKVYYCPQLAARLQDGPQRFPSSGICGPVSFPPLQRKDGVSNQQVITAETDFQAHNREKHGFHLAVSGCSVWRRPAANWSCRKPPLKKTCQEHTPHEQDIKETPALFLQSRQRTSVQPHWSSASLKTPSQNHKPEIAHVWFQVSTYGNGLSSGCIYINFTQENLVDK